ncbi:MAG: uncharacterized membrane protein YsdA (DUF1294 family)/cold shock CspA family protein [Psychromonas sp.]|jgi:uncharacterized membrane protein YsdA (DUF1294 family)/cold shock CspA family protein|uniref:DUF1294 domain-containing protein n=1 Tax=Psychromonas sp. TaxID=1884585 RepID=UPI0039E25CC5
MQLQGKILNWNDDKGFGFVEPNGGGERAFVHIKAFRPDARRPVNGEVILYELVRENKNRYKADNITFASDVKSSNKGNKTKNASPLGTVFVLVFCIGLLLSVFIGKLPLMIAGLYIVMSLIAFIAYALDKSAAQNGRWRTRESTLHLFSLVGGWPGAFFAQTKLRHKSSKQAFKSVYRVTVVFNLAGLFWLYTDKGTNFLNNVVLPLVNGQ